MHHPFLKLEKGIYPIKEVYPFLLFID